jgi:hypothetical protein
MGSARTWGYTSGTDNLVGTLGEVEVLSGGGGGTSEDPESLASSEPEDAGEDDSADEPEEDSSFASPRELEDRSSEWTEPSSSGSLSWDVSKPSASSASSFLFSQRGLKTGCVGIANARADDDEKCLCVSRLLFLGYPAASCFDFGDAARVVSWLNALRNSKNVEFAAYDERERAAIRMAPRAAMVKRSMSS